MTKNLEEKRLNIKDNEHTFEQLKEIFGISSSTYYKWKKNKVNSGFYVLPKIAKATRRRKVDPDVLMKIVEENPDLFLHEIAQKFNCSVVAIFKRLKQQKMTLKKRHSHIQKNPNKQEKNTRKIRKYPHS